MPYTRSGYNINYKKSEETLLVSSYRYDASITGAKKPEETEQGSNDWKKILKNR